MCQNDIYQKCGERMSRKKIINDDVIVNARRCPFLQRFDHQNEIRCLRYKNMDKIEEISVEDVQDLQHRLRGLSSRRAKQYILLLQELY
jgi:hypothetical protein